MPDPGPDGPLPKLIYAAFLVGICVLIHAAGLIGLGAWMNRVDARRRRHFWRDLWMMVRAAWAIILLHLLEIMVWAGFYTSMDCLPDLHTAFYFSAVTYSTLGYGDVVLTNEWHSLSGVEALTGILMAGLSTGFFFTFLNRLFSARKHT